MWNCPCKSILQASKGKSLYVAWCDVPNKPIDVATIVKQAGAWVHTFAHQLKIWKPCIQLVPICLFLFCSLLRCFRELVLVNHLGDFSRNGSMIVEDNHQFSLPRSLIQFFTATLIYGVPQHNIVLILLSRILCRDRYSNIIYELPCFCRLFVPISVPHIAYAYSTVLLFYIR